MWLFRGGKVNRDEILLLSWDDRRLGYAVGVPNEKRRVIEVFLYIPEYVGGPLHMFRWIPHRKESITQSAAFKLSEKAYNSIVGNGVIPKGWENIPNN